MRNTDRTLSPTNVYITGIRTVDASLDLHPSVSAGGAALRQSYSYGVTLLQTDIGLTGVGLAFTLGGGNRQLCDLVEELGRKLVGRDIEELMSGFGREFRSVAEDSRYLELGSHRGMVRHAIASLTNACFDLWAKSREVPLWRLLLDLSPSELVATLDLSYIDDVLTAEDAVNMLAGDDPGREQRSKILNTGYPASDTSFAGMSLSDEKLLKRAKASVSQGFGAIKLTVGASDNDVRRANLLRSKLGAGVSIMLDANQAWDLRQAIAATRAFADMGPYWIEEPTHADDILGHALIAREVAPTRVATGKHVPNRVLFKQLLQVNALHYVQADVVRLGGISEFLTVSLLAKKYDKSVVPHAGDLAQIHQHLVIFNHIALDHDVLFLEYVPHLRHRFLHPPIVEDGFYWTPEEPGAASDLILD